MRALLTDLDRTLTGPDLKLDERALVRVRLLREHGVRVVVVTGRRLEEIEAMGLTKEVDATVAENGAIVVSPEGIEILMPAWREQAEAALGRLAKRFAWGRVIASGPRDLAPEASHALRAAGVDHSISFNAEEVMLLPAGIDKASGATRALAILGISPDEAWAIGDGENDVPMLLLAKLSAAPTHAHVDARRAADVLLSASYSKAFVELTEPLVR